MIETARLVLREPDARDLDALRAYHARNAERFARWDPVPGDDPDVHASWIAARRFEGGREKPTSFLAFARGSDAVVALVSLTSFNAHPPSASLSYSVDGALEGRGYAFEAVGGVVTYAFDALGLASVNAQYDPANERSARLLQRLGFRIVGITPVVPGMERFMRTLVETVRERSTEA